MTTPSIRPASSRIATTQPQDPGARPAEEGGGYLLLVPGATQPDAGGPVDSFEPPSPQPGAAITGSAPVRPPQEVFARPVRSQVRFSGTEKLGEAEIKVMGWVQFTNGSEPTLDAADLWFSKKEPLYGLLPGSNVPQVFSWDESTLTHLLKESVESTKFVGGRIHLDFLPGSFAQSLDADLETGRVQLHFAENSEREHLFADLPAEVTPIAG